MRPRECRDVQQEDLPVRAPAVDEQQRGPEAPPASGGPVSSTLTRRPPISSLRWSDGLDVDPGRVVAVGVRRIGAGPQQRRPEGAGQSDRCGSHVGATVSTARAMKIAIDIDSTLHHYWDLLASATQRRFGVALPYDEQLSWTITSCAPSRCVRSSGDPLATSTCSPPSPTRARWRRSAAGTRPGTSSTSRRTAPAPATQRRAVARRDRPAFDELYCSVDKVSRCREIGIDVLVDDSPDNRRPRSTPASPPRRSCIPGTASCVRRRTSSAAPTGTSWRRGWSPCSRDPRAPAGPALPHVARGRPSLRGALPSSARPSTTIRTPARLPPLTPDP